VDSRGVNGASVYTLKNSDHVLKDSRMEACLLACVIQKGLKTGRKE